jgi:ribosomal protein S6
VDRKHLIAFFGKRKLLKEIKNKRDSGDWVIFNEEGFSPAISFVKKEDFDANYYYGQIVTVKLMCNAID